MKRLLTLLTLLALAVSGAALAQPSPLPDDSRFDQPVQFVTDAGGASLRGMLQALSESVGLVPVFGEFSDRAITQEIDTPTPFRQVWSLVLSLYDLDYLLQDNDVVVIGTPAGIRALRPAPTPTEAPTVDTPEAEPIVAQTYRINNPAEAVTGQLEALVPGIVVEALPLGNSIVVRGTAAQQAEVQSVLDQFDIVVTQSAVVADPVEQRTYQLSNAKAEELAAVLQASGVVTTTSGSGDDASTTSTQIIDNFSVTAEPRTNSLIVTATRPVQAQLAELIPSLDVPQKQVNIQLRIQEIQRRTAQNFGLDVDADFGNLSVNIMESGLSLESIFNANPFISGLNILAVLDALETQGLSRRVDDSNITVLNNEEGRIQSGGRIELQFAGIDGQISSRTIEFGVIITMTPRVSNDGRVILEVKAEVSDVLVPLSEGGIPQRIDFSEREVTSTVTLEQGQTVLLGGLLQNNFSRSETRVPILGSIPVIGELFGSTITEDEATELLLVVNAQVIE